MNRAVEAIKRIVRTVAEPTPLHRAPRSPIPGSTPLRPWGMPDDVKQPYRNYLENKLREHFNFKGVPVRIFFRKK